MRELWHGAWQIAKYELRLSWRGYLITLLFLAYASFFAIVFLYGHLGERLISRTEWSLDLLYSCMLPIMGFLMDQTTFRYRREDTYSRKLAEWQTMPISVGTVIAGRMTLLIFIMLVNWLIFFGLQYAVLEGIREMLDPAAFIVYALTWLGYAVFMASMLVFMEMGFSGRVYFIGCFVFVVIAGLLTLMIAFFKGNAVLYTLEAAAGRKWEMAVVSIAAAVMAVWGFGLLLNRRIRLRSYWG